MASPSWIPDNFTFWPSQKPVDKILSFHEKPYGNNSQFHIPHIFIDSETVCSVCRTFCKADEPQSRLCLARLKLVRFLPCLRKGSERCHRCQRQVLLLIKGQWSAASTKVCMTNVTWTRTLGYTAVGFVWKQKSWWFHFSE